MFTYTETATNICQGNKQILVQPREKQQKALENGTENTAKAECYKGTSFHKVTEVPSKTCHKLENIR